MKNLKPQNPSFLIQIGTHSIAVNGFILIIIILKAKNRSLKRSKLPGKIREISIAKDFHFYVSFFDGQSFNSVVGFVIIRLF